MSQGSGYTAAVHAALDLAWLQKGKAAERRRLSASWSSARVPCTRGSTGTRAPGNGGGSRCAHSLFLKPKGKGFFFAGMQSGKMHPVTPKGLSQPERGRKGLRL